MAHIGLEPKSSHTIKYSQPFELILFHVIELFIKYFKRSSYPHLLNNYLINYLIFLGSYIFAYFGILACFHSICNIEHVCIIIWNWS